MPRLATGPLVPDALADWYAVVPPHEGLWVRASMISTLDGRVTGPDGTSSSLNQDSPGDRAVFAHLRSWADVVVVGAGTVRTEGYPALPDVAMVVVSRSGVVPAEVEDGDGVVVLGGDGQAVAASEVLELCRDRGWQNVLLEGGPALLGGWLQEGAVHELCLTLRPVLMGGAATPLIGPEVDLHGSGAPLGTPTHVLAWGEDLLLRVDLRR